MKKVVLIDADILLFKVTQPNEIKVDWGDGFKTEYSDLEHIKYVFDETVEGVVKKVGADDYLLCFTGENNFRRNLDGIEYKLNRTSEKPMNYSSLKEYALEKHPCKLYDNLEADDVIGILMTIKQNKEVRIIHSDDKDLWTIPGLIWDRKKNKVVMNTLLEADRFLFKQILMGDAVDGYKGCPKIGKVKAERILAPCKNVEEMRSAALDTYEKAYKKEGKEFAKNKMKQQATLARILRAEDYNFKTKEIILWEPWRDDVGSSQDN